jgi:hypothetical protein
MSIHDDPARAIKKAAEIARAHTTLRPANRKRRIIASRRYA